MFPNIDTKLGLKAVHKALNSRTNKFPSTQCILSAVELCLKYNNSYFEREHYIQTEGTAIGQKNSCSYADIAMTDIDFEAMNNGPYIPEYWSRFRDDCLDIWTHGEHALYEFTDFLNSISTRLGMKTNLSFTVKYSERKLDFLDITIYLEDGKLEFDVYSKSTDSHLYLLPDSCHPKKNTENIPYGVALRLRRICSKEETFDNRSKEYKQYFVNRDYDHGKVLKHFEKVEQITREDALKPTKHQQRDMIPLITKYDPRIPNLRGVIRRNLRLLYSDPNNKTLFPKKDLTAGYSRAKNLKEILVPTKLPTLGHRDDNSLPWGCFKCKAKTCDICKNYLVPGNRFQSLSTKDTFKIKNRIDCNEQNVIYLIACTSCGVQYVGSSVDFKPRFREHKSDIKLKKTAKCRTAEHWATHHKSVDFFKIMLIEKVCCKKENVEAFLHEREICWQHTLMTMEPHGMNRRDELYIGRKHFPKY